MATIIINTDECFECGEPAIDMHHVIPKSKGGTKMIPLCDKCHGLVHDKDFVTMKRLKKEGIKKAQANGVHCGRMKGTIESKEDFLNKYPHIIKLLKEDNSVRDVYKILGNHHWCTIAKVRKLIGDEL